MQIKVLSTILTGKIHLEVNKGFNKHIIEINYLFPKQFPKWPGNSLCLVLWIIYLHELNKKDWNHLYCLQMLLCDSNIKSI